MKVSFLFYLEERLHEFGRVFTKKYQTRYFKRNCRFSTSFGGFMKKHEKYLEVLKSFNGYITIEEWATKFVKVYPEETNQEKDKKTIVRDLTKNISALISTKKWDNYISIDTSKKPKKIKYDINKQKEDIISTNIKQSKYIPFETLMSALQDDDDDYNEYDYDCEDDDDYDDNDEDKFRNRNKHYNHFENAKFNGYRYYIAFQMAIRNKDVIEISKKLDYISEIIMNNSVSSDFRDWICGIESWEDIYQGKPPELTINSDSKKKLIEIAKMPLVDFINDIDFEINTKEFKKENSQSAIFLKIIADYLQNKLIKEYYIYKDGYYFINDLGYFNPEEVMDNNSIDKDDCHIHELQDSIKEFITTLIDCKTNHLKKTADMFFMYDYSKKAKVIKTEASDNDAQTAINKKIKFILTKYHGIEIKNNKTILTYDECLEKYEGLIEYEVSFYTGEETIKDKINLMEKFIEQKLYKYILFY
jgi:hypothetical protein